MLFPSIDKLTDKAESKYTLVTVASKRARQLRENNSTLQMDKPRSKKHVGQALEEFISDKLVFDKPESRK